MRSKALPARKLAAQYLRRHALKVVTAESSTAGLIASRLAELPGAGETLECAFVVYDPKAKQRCLGVRTSTLARCNLTSEEVALEMAQGALARSDAGAAVANTGVTDDTDPDIAPGTQCFAWIFRQHFGTQAFTETRVFHGSRNEIRTAAADYALERLVYHHQRLHPLPGPAGTVRPDAFRAAPTRPATASLTPAV